MDKHILYTYNGILIDNKKGQTLHAQNNIDESQNHYGEQRSSLYCTVILYDFTYKKI